MIFFRPQQGQHASHLSVWFSSFLCFCGVCDVLRHTLFLATPGDGGITMSSWHPSNSLLSCLSHSFLGGWNSGIFGLIGLAGVQWFGMVCHVLRVMAWCCWFIMTGAMIEVWVACPRARGWRAAPTSGGGRAAGEYH